MFVRKLHPGMGQAVAERTILRQKDNNWETWGDVAERVALGNSLLCKDEEEQKQEKVLLQKHISKGVLLMSGRHLQHGDENQPNNTQELFTNCATANNSFCMFLLLMNGSGVGRCYDDDLMMINWDNAPGIRCVLDESHADFNLQSHESSRDARHKYGDGDNVIWHKIRDTREGWAKALEVWELLAFEKIHKDKLLILDFSDVRAKGSPIKGMQNRPASGPVPLMQSFERAGSVKGSGLPPWRQAMYIDHYFAECVLVGGARRSSRMSTKYWKDKTIFDFITVKRPIEYLNQSPENINQIKKECQPSSFLWSSNNSVTIDQSFWDYVKSDKKSPIAQHAKKVFELVTQCAYYDGTGEPGFINVDQLVQNDENLEEIAQGEYIASQKYQVEDDTKLYLKKLIKASLKKKYQMIVNPCGEEPLAVWSGFCTIADTVPYHADTIEEAEEAIRVATRALIRVNTMDSIYNKEVKRTNRIGVGITGVHEFAWKFFGYSFKDLVNEEKSKDFWMTLNRFNEAMRDEAEKYCKKLGLTLPHTISTVKPSGSVSKLFGLTEGWHLPAMSWYIRWVQFSVDDPLVEEYKDSGYPVKSLKKYKNSVIVGFPTEPVICSLGMNGQLVTASEATPEEQYQWLKLGEKYWLEGVTDNHQGKRGGQISYTLKYDTKKVSYEEFKNVMLKNQSQVRCCSVMPKEDESSYEYLPEEVVTQDQYEEICRNIEQSLQEDISKEHIDCESGACPINFRENKSVSLT